MDNSILEEQKKLGMDFIDKFKDSSKRNWDIAMMRLYPKDPIIKAVQKDLKRVLAKSDEYAEDCKKDINIIDYRTIYKIFCLDINDKPLSAKTINKLVEYISLANPVGIVEKEITSNWFKKGVIVIDENFISSKIKRLTQNEIIDFYTRKNIGSVQWSGVINGFDIDRPIMTLLKKEVLLAFKHKSSKVCAVITAPSGSGKSTILRRLAIRLITVPNLIVLWITDLVDFVNSLKTEIYNKRCLIIIEDWNSLKEHSADIATFFNYLSNKDNIQVVIGDYDANHKQYLEHVYGENIFPLKVKENEFIVSEIVKEKLTDLKSIYDEILLSGNLFNAPLYITLFVLFRIFSQKNEIEIDVKDFQSQFKKIIVNDLSNIYRQYKGLAKTIYYWACVRTEFEIEAPLEVWFRIADTFNGDDRVTHELIPYDDKNPIWGILSHYIYIERMIHPALTDMHLVKFHHELLLEALADTPYDATWYFNKNVKIEIIQKFLDQKQFGIASELYWAPNKMEKKAQHDQFPDGIIMYGRPKYDLSNFKNASQLKYFNSVLERFSHTFSKDVRANTLLNAIYESVKEHRSDDELKLIVAFIVFYFHHYKYTATWHTIFSNIIDLGCKSPIIEYARGMSYSEYTVSELYDQAIWGKTDFDPDSPFKNWGPIELNLLI